MNGNIHMHNKITETNPMPQTKMKRALTRNGYTRSVWSQKQINPGIESKIDPASHAIGGNTCSFA